MRVNDVELSVTGRYKPAPGYQRELSSLLLNFTTISLLPTVSMGAISTRNAL